MLMYGEITHLFMIWRNYLVNFFIIIKTFVVNNTRDALSPLYDYHADSLCSIIVFHDSDVKYASWRLTSPHRCTDCLFNGLSG